MNDFCIYMHFTGIIILPEKFTITVLLLLLVTVYDSLL